MFQWWQAIICTWRLISCRWEDDCSSLKRTPVIWDYICNHLAANPMPLSPFCFLHEKTKHRKYLNCPYCNGNSPFPIYLRITNESKRWLCNLYRFKNHSCEICGMSMNYFLPLPDSIMRNIKILRKYLHLPTRRCFILNLHFIQISDIFFIIMNFNESWNWLYFWLHYPKAYFQMTGGIESNLFQS